ncbi:MAG: hypothetical protein QOD76_654 [Solirubrobacteraceae bacterium]|jgi:hypothetical protein|nr:hypothetical protein [Solirubrobacteraceae bacterium]
MTGPDLAVVVASVNGLPYLADCLGALERHCPAAEVIVADRTDATTRAYVRERWPQVSLLSFDEELTVPQLRAAAIDEAKASHVAVIEDHCLVGRDWAERILVAHAEGHAVVGGAVRNGATARIRDWAAFLCEYSEHMDPVPDGPVPSLPGGNVSYDRRALGAVDTLLRGGYWETWLHPRLQRDGFELWSDSGLVLDHVKDFGVREFASQRYHYARSHAGMLNPELGPRRVVHLFGSPLLPPVLYLRIARNVLKRRRHRRELLAATPLLLVYLCIWAYGEAVGYSFGGGHSLLKVR